jgi:hypothetical protein
MNGTKRWLDSRTYSFVIMVTVGSFVLDWFKEGGTWVVVVPACLMLIGGRMARDVRLQPKEEVGNADDQG